MFVPLKKNLWASTACYGDSFTFVICRWYSYLTGNTPVHLHDQLRGTCFYVDVVRTTGNNSIGLHGLLRGELYFHGVPFWLSWLRNQCSTLMYSLKYEPCPDRRASFFKVYLFNVSLYASATPYPIPELHSTTTGLLSLTLWITHEPSGTVVTVETFKCGDAVQWSRQFTKHSWPNIGILYASTAGLVQVANDCILERELDDLMVHHKNIMPVIQAFLSH
jgi:hypothetical protein